MVACAGNGFQLGVTQLVDPLSFVWLSIPPPYLFWIEAFCSSELLPPTPEQEEKENRINQQLLIGVPCASSLSVSHLELHSHRFKDKNKTCWYMRFFHISVSMQALLVHERPEAGTASSSHALCHAHCCQAHCPVLTLQSEGTAVFNRNPQKTGRILLTQQFVHPHPANWLRHLWDLPFPATPVPCLLC